MKKYCNFCGAPLKDSAKECEQCGWDRSQDGPPSSDPADTKARIGVSAGLLVAYAVMWTLIQSAPDVARATPVSMSYDAPATSTASVGEPAAGPAISLSVAPAAAVTAPPVTGPTAKPLSIKVADVKLAHIKPHDALDYGFVVPETDQKCHLVGQLHGTGGYDQDLETFLLTDDEYVFWHANTAAIPPSSWDTRRGSETTLAYDLPGAGNYHLVISNSMSPTDKSVQVKALVHCAR
ncbi:MAG: zinc ribbon domain-containing protein [Gemmatimonadota bacterium]|nr:zinc ribbon domain-containing protein [Gemmatimonadota bacterium]